LGKFNYAFAHVPKENRLALLTRGNLVLYVDGESKGQELRLKVEADWNVTIMGKVDVAETAERLKALSDMMAIVKATVN
jgi:hypothetical protein